VGSTFYDGKCVISALGDSFTPLQWFLDSTFSFPASVVYNIDQSLELPLNVTLIGKLFSGQGEFQSTVSIVKMMNSPH